MQPNLTKTWTASLLRRSWPHMSLGSVLRYRSYLLREARGEANPERKISLSLRSPIRGDVVLRQVPADFFILEEIVFEQVYRTVFAHLRRCETAIDLGANIGLASLYLASLYPACKIIAVEPNAKNFEVLTTNLESLVRAGRCRALQAAVWSSEARLVPDTSKSPERFHAFAVRESAPGQALPAEIRAMIMDRILEVSGFAEVDLLKVDIEGAETELFKGDLSWLARVNAIAIEFHGESRIASHFDDAMRKFGFCIYKEDRHTVLAVKK